MRSIKTPIRKTTVEECLSLSVRDIAPCLKSEEWHGIRWAYHGIEGSTLYFRSVSGEPTKVILRYAISGGLSLTLPIRMQQTPLHFGGHRWWFTCPLASNGIACEKRVGKLHLPLDGTYFGCRTCHDLTYRSCQEAHRFERAMQFLLRTAAETHN